MCSPDVKAELNFQKADIIPLIPVIKKNSHLNSEMCEKGQVAFMAAIDEDKYIWACEKGKVVGQSFDSTRVQDEVQWCFRDKMRRYANAKNRSIAFQELQRTLGSSVSDDDPLWDCGDSSTINLAD